MNRDIGKELRWRTSQVKALINKLRETYKIGPQEFGELLACTNQQDVKAIIKKLEVLEDKDKPPVTVDSNTKQAENKIRATDFKDRAENQPEGHLVFNSYTQEITWCEKKRGEDIIYPSLPKQTLRGELNSILDDPHHRNIKYTLVSANAVDGYKQLLNNWASLGLVDFPIHDERKAKLKKLFRDNSQYHNSKLLENGYSFGWEFLEDTLGVGPWAARKIIYEAILRLWGITIPSMDEMIIFASREGAYGKTKIMEALFPGYHTNVTTAAMYDEYNYMASHSGKMIVNLDELTVFRMPGADFNAIKASITATKLERRKLRTDELQVHPRTHVYVGTTNRIDCIPTALAGDRRFLALEIAPFELGKDEEHPVGKFYKVRDQIIVEALVKLKPYLDRFEKAKENKKEREAICKELSNLIPTFYDPSNPQAFRDSQERFCSSKGSSQYEYNFIEELYEQMSRTNLEDPENRPWIKEVIIEMMGFENNVSRDSRTLTKAMEADGWAEKRIRFSRNKKKTVCFPPSYSGPRDDTASIITMEEYQRNDDTPEPAYTFDKIKIQLKSAFKHYKVGPAGSKSNPRTCQILWAACAACKECSPEVPRQQLWDHFKELHPHLPDSRLKEFKSAIERYKPGKITSATLFMASQNELKYGNIRNCDVTSLPPSEPTGSTEKVKSDFSCLDSCTQIFQVTDEEIYDLFPPLEGMTPCITRKINKPELKNNEYWHVNYKRNGQNPQFTTGPVPKVMFGAAHGLFYEFDGFNTVQEQLVTLLELDKKLPVTFFISTGSRSLHVHILLEKPFLNMKLWEKLQEALVQKLGSDNLKDASRLLRSPNTDKGQIPYMLRRNPPFATLKQVEDFLGIDVSDYAKQITAV